MLNKKKQQHVNGLSAKVESLEKTIQSLQSKIKNNNSAMLEQAEAIDETRSSNDEVKLRMMKEMKNRMIRNHVVKASKK